MIINPRTEVLRELQDRLRETEQTCRTESEDAAPLPRTPIDCFWRGRRGSWGRLVEWFDDGPGGGAVTAAVATARAVLGAGGAMVVVDPDRTWFAGGAAALRLPLDRLVGAFPEHPQDAWWAVEESLRSRAAAVVMGRFDRVKERVSHRWRMAAESGRSLGFLIRSRRYVNEPSWADLRLHVRACPPDPLRPVRRFHLVSVDRQDEHPGVLLEVDDETGDVHLVPEMGDSTPVSRATRMPRSPVDPVRDSP